MDPASYGRGAGVTRVSAGRHACAAAAFSSADVIDRLVELDPRNAEAARGLAAAANLSGVEIVTGDAALTSQYADLAPADLVLACGLFGNMTDDHIERMIDYCTRLCATGGTVVWTRARWEPDLVPQICAWFEERDFERVWLSQPEPGYR